MSTSALPPTAPTTLAIVLGASAWPNSPGFQASEAFVHAAQGFRDYLLDPHPHGFGLPVANLLDLFDADSSTSDQLSRLSSFLKERIRVLSAANQAVRDVLVSFVGHGGFAGSSHDFYLLPRQADTRILRASGMAIDALAEVLREQARQTRRYLFLDCCFAAAAFRAFQGAPDQTAIAKTLDAFAVQARSRGSPQKGTVLLCSSDHKTPSLLLPDESCTMFSYALLKVLKNGDFHRPIQLSLRDIKDLAEDQLAALPQQNAPRPGLHSPDQSEGDVADVPLFPNPRAAEEQARQAEQERLKAEEKERARHVQKEMPPDQSFRQKPGDAGQLPLQTPVRTTLYTYRGHSGTVKGVAWSPDGTRIASGGYDKKVQVWGAADGGHVFTYRGFQAVNAVAWSPDGTRIASGGFGQKVQVWDAADGRHIYTYRGHSQAVGVAYYLGLGGVREAGLSLRAVAWSPDGTRIASGGGDHTVQVWDAADGRHIYTYRGHSETVDAVAWSPDGTRIASGGGDHTVQVWDAE